MNCLNMKMTCPPSLSHLGKLRLPSNKAELTDCLQSYCKPCAELPEDVRVGGAVASWLVRSSLGRAVWVRPLAGDAVLCSWAIHLTRFLGET